MQRRVAQERVGEGQLLMRAAVLHGAETGQLCGAERALFWIWAIERAQNCMAEYIVAGGHAFAGRREAGDDSAARAEQQPLVGSWKLRLGLVEEAGQAGQRQ